MYHRRKEGCGEARGGGGGREKEKEEEQEETENTKQETERKIEMSQYFKSHNKNESFAQILRFD